MEVEVGRRDEDYVDKVCRTLRSAERQKRGG